MSACNSDRSMFKSVLASSDGMKKVFVEGGLIGCMRGSVRS